MKKLIIALALCLVLVVLTAVPAMAAKPILTFTTGLTNTSGSLSEGYTVATDGVPNTWVVLDLQAPTIADPGLRDGMYAFYLKSQGPQKNALKAYFADPAKGWPQDYLDQMNVQIAGGAPFFYLVSANNQYSLIDGFTYALTGISAPLRIDNDYPEGTYEYKGHLKASNQALLQVTVTFNVTR